MINDMSFYSLVLMINGFTEMDISMDVLFTLFGNKSPTRHSTRYITKVPDDLSELMDCLVRTVSIKLPSLLKITTDRNLQIVRVYLNYNNVDISDDTPVSSRYPANKPVSSLSLPQVINTKINSPSSNPISVEQKTERNAESMKMPESNINSAKPRTINLTNFLGSADIDTDAPDDDL